MEDRFQVGIISSAHGVKGEVKVFPTTDDIRRFKKLKEVIMTCKGEEKTIELEGVKLSNQMVILKLKGIDDRDSADRLRNLPLFVDRKDAVKLKKDEYFVADLIGIEVYDDSSELLGSLVDVIFTGANDVYVIEEKGKDEGQLLIPAIKECILSVEPEANRMTVHLMEGLR
ncbi:MAG: ribosome maturation factor RimM [Lachnospiraceae bacterium]|nr:ribosome maturation factor RimM [Lachnospiraceae bacterium]